jgi:hypothetical protein
MPKRKYAVVAWLPEDVVENAEEMGTGMTEAEAARLLEAEEMRIIDAMVAAGWSAIENALGKRAAAEFLPTT